MSNKILTITATIELPDDEFERAATVAECAALPTVMKQWIKDSGRIGTVTHDFVTKRAPKAATPAVVKQAAE